MSAAPALSAQNVSVRIGATPIVEGANLALRRGEVVVLVGPNGAGKTTLVRALAGLLPAAGTIVIDGVPVAALAPRERARRIAYLPQGQVFHWPLAVAAVVALGRHPHADPFSGATDADRVAVARALTATGTETLAARTVTTLSGGERARVALARALSTEAPILLADEPTGSLDPRQQLIVMDLLRSIARNGGAVLAVLHDVVLAARLADRVLLMRDGRIVADAPPAEALGPERLAEVFGVESHTVETPGGRLTLPWRPL